MFFVGWEHGQNAFGWGKKLKPGGYKAEKDAASDYQGLESVGRSYAE